jgi:hypothetical protein
MLPASRPQAGRRSAQDREERRGSNGAGTAPRQRKGGAVAFSREVDIETDTYDEPRVLSRVGSLPPGLFEAQ